MLSSIALRCYTFFSREENSDSLPINNGLIEEEQRFDIFKFLKKKFSSCTKCFRFAYPTRFSKFCKRKEPNQNEIENNQIL